MREIETFREYLRISSVHPNVNYGNDLHNYVLLSFTKQKSLTNPLTIRWLCQLLAEAGG